MKIDQQNQRLQQINGDYFFIFLGKLTNDIYILLDIRNKYFASIFMFGTIFLLVFNVLILIHIWYVQWPLTIYFAFLL